MRNEKLVRRVIVGSPAHTRSILRDLHRKYVEEMEKASEQASDPTPR